MSTPDSEPTQGREEVHIFIDHGKGAHTHLTVDLPLQITVEDETVYCSEPLEVPELFNQPSPTPKPRAAQTQNELLPCPHCGSGNIGIWQTGIIFPNIHAGFAVNCHDCTSCGRWDTDLVVAISWWNRRASASTPSAAVHLEQIQSELRRAYDLVSMTMPEVASIISSQREAIDDLFESLQPPATQEEKS